MNNRIFIIVFLVFFLLLSLASATATNNSALSKIHPLVLAEITGASDSSSSPSIDSGNDLVGTKITVGSKRIRVLLSLNSASKLNSVGEKVLGKNGTVKGKYRLGKTLVVELPANKIEEIAGDSAVREVWPDREVTADLLQSVPQINAPAEWALGYSGQGVKVAVIDTGIDESHELLQGKVIASANFSSSTTTSDVLGHGTHVAGIIAGNGSIKGVAPEALLLNAKVLNDSGSGSISSVIAGINWAVENGAQVINLSLGGAYNDPESPLNIAIKDAVAQGVVVVVSVGNCGSCPGASCNGYIGVTTPGNSPEAISVGAVDASNNHACFSSGENLDGIGIKPDLSAPGINIYSSVPNGFAVKSGTSMAAPFVSGAAAIALSANSSLSPLQLKQLLESNAIDLGEQGKDTEYGAGALNLLDLNFFGIDSNITVPDTNSDTNSDDRHDLDVNSFQAAFELVAPSELQKNELGTFSMKKLGQSSLAVQSEDSIDTIVEFVIKDRFGFIVSREFVGPIEIRPTQGQDFDLEWSSNDVGAYSIEAGIFESGTQAAFVSENDVNAMTVTKSFRVIVPQIVAIESFNAPETANKGENATFSVLAKNTGNIDLNGFLEIRFVDSTGNIVGIANSQNMLLLQNSTATFSLAKTIDLPDGNYSAQAILHFEDQNVETSKNFRVIVPATANISAFSVPATVQKDSNIAIQLTISNTGSFTISPMISLQIFDSNELLASTILGGQDINAGKTRNYTASIPATFTAGKNYSLTASIYYNGNKQSQTKQFAVTDSTAPSILNVTYSKTTVQLNASTITATISDASQIASVKIALTKPNKKITTKQMIAITTSDSGTTFSFAPENELAGTYYFTITACDIFNNCKTSTKYSFTASTLASVCTDKKVLVVKDNDSFSLATDNNALDWTKSIPTSYCITNWQTRLNASPSLSFLKQFNVIVWSAGNNFANSIDASDANLLQVFIAGGGRLFLEGADIASEHVGDSLLETMQTVFLEETNQTTLTAKPHYITNGISSMVIDSSQSPYSDAVLPNANSVSLLEFSDGESTMILTNNTVAFASFSLNSLPEAQKTTLVSNALSWLTKPVLLTYPEENKEIDLVDYFKWISNCTKFSVQVSQQASFSSPKTLATVTTKQLALQNYATIINSIEKTDADKVLYWRITASCSSGTKYSDIQSFRIKKPLKIASATADKYYSTNTALKAIDGSTSTYWSTQGKTAPFTICFDLNKQVQLEKIVLQFNSSYYAKDYSLFASITDCNDYSTTIKTVTNNTKATTIDTISPTSARFVILSITNTTNNQIRLNEAQIFGETQ